MSTIAIDKCLTRGLQASLALTPIEDGKLRYTTDTGRCYLDFKDDEGNLKRVRITDVEFDYTEEQILALTSYKQKLYIAADTAAAFYNIGGTWQRVGGVTLAKDSSDKNYVLWFSSEDGDQPLYNTGLTYNPSTNTISVDHIVVQSVTVGNMTITETVTDENDYLVDFVINA